ncbi:MAG TPA: hypothetical protein VF331_11765 [Polyangiales bacterium]
MDRVITIPAALLSPTSTQARFASRVLKSEADRSAAPSSGIARAWRTSVLAAMSTLLGAGCGAELSAAPQAAAPTRYEGSCAFVGIEDAPGPTDQNSDSVSLVAAYSFGERTVPAPGGPVALDFLVEHSRVDDPSSHLQQQPIELCRPGRNTAEPQATHGSDAAAFGGQRG